MVWKMGMASFDKHRPRFASMASDVQVEVRLATGFQLNDYLQLKIRKLSADLQSTRLSDVRDAADGFETLLRKRGF